MGWHQLGSHERSAPNLLKLPLEIWKEAFRVPQLSDQTCVDHPYLLQTICIFIWLVFQMEIFSLSWDFLHLEVTGSLLHLHEWRDHDLWWERCYQKDRGNSSSSSKGHFLRHFHNERSSSRSQPLAFLSFLSLRPSCSTTALAMKIWAADSIAY